MENKTHILRFRAVNRDIFDAIVDGSKKVETRAATKKFQTIAGGDRLKLVCGNREAVKKVKAVKKFKTLSALLNAYEPQDINPNCTSAAQLEKMYFSFPGYREKLEQYGLIALELE